MLPRQFGGLTLAEIVRGVQAGEESALAALYVVLRIWRFWLVREIGVDHAEDALHDSYLATATAIRDGAIRDPERLLAFTRTICYRQRCRRIAEIVERRKELDASLMDHDYTLDAHDGGATRQICYHFMMLRHAAAVDARPDNILEKAEEQQIVEDCLRKLKPKEQEILRRFYWDGEKEPQIRAAMQISSTQFRLAKYRAKAKLTQLVSKRLATSGCLVVAAKDRERAA